MRRRDITRPVSEPAEARSQAEILAGGRRSMFWVGIATGASILAWLALSPLIDDGHVWWPFRFGLIVEKLRYDLVSRPRLAGWEEVARILPLLSFGAAWLMTRRQTVSIELDVLRATHADERAAAVRRSDALWSEAERAELADDDALQLELLDEYVKASAIARALRGRRTARVARLRGIARAVEPRDPKLALQLLSIARRLHERGDNRVPNLAMVVAADAGFFTLGVLACAGVLILGSLAVASLLGLVVAIVKAIVAIVAIALVAAAIDD